MEKISLKNIFKVFFKIGVILLGGGYVIVPILKDELVVKRNWLKEEELLDFYCVAQCLPGIIAINTSILVGNKLMKLKGAIMSVFALSLSPIISIIIIAKILSKISNIPLIDAFFWGINLSVIILVYITLKDMWNKSIVDKFSIFWFILITILAILKLSLICLIMGSIIMGLVLQFIKKDEEENNE